MDRRTFGKLVSLTALGGLAQRAELEAQEVGSTKALGFSGEELVLQDETLLVAFDKRSGTITRLERLGAAWKIQRRPELAMSFRLLVPLP